MTLRRGNIASVRQDRHVRGRRHDHISLAGGGDGLTSWFDSCQGRVSWRQDELLPLRFGRGRFSSSAPINMGACGKGNVTSVQTLWRSVILSTVASTNKQGLPVLHPASHLLNEDDLTYRRALHHYPDNKPNEGPERIHGSVLPNGSYSGESYRLLTSVTRPSGLVYL